MKKCGKCGEEKERNQFYRQARSSDGLQWMCKTCNGSRYHENPEKYKSWSSARRNDFRSRLLTYLVEHPCVDCGESDPVVLQFDHVRGVKTLEIARMMNRNCAWPKVESEIEKCEVRCANCHARKTAADFGWYKSTKSVDTRLDFG